MCIHHYTYHIHVWRFWWSWSRWWFWWVLSSRPGLKTCWQVSTCCTYTLNSGRAKQLDQQAMPQAMSSQRKTGLPTWIAPVIYQESRPACPPFTPFNVFGKGKQVTATVIVRLLHTFRLGKSLFWGWSWLWCQTGKITLTWVVNDCSVHVIVIQTLICLCSHECWTKYSCFYSRAMNCKQYCRWSPVRWRVWLPCREASVSPWLGS